MANICINGLNSRTGGGKSILNNYLKILLNSKLNHKYFILTPNFNEYKKYEKNNITIIIIPKFLGKVVFYPFLYIFYLNKCLKNYNIDIILNLADIPIKTSIKQVYLFDWSYAVYPKSIIWKSMKFYDKIYRKTKLYYFRKYINQIDLFIAQSETIKKRLEQLYGITSILVVPNAVSLDNLKDNLFFDFKLPIGINLLYLTHYYPHKNLEIFISIATIIKEKKLPYKLIITIESEQHKGAKLLLNKIYNLALNDIIINIGPVEMKYVPSLYKQCDGLLMPTLLESFSGTYVEAMYHKIPIFTSDIDFAHGVCEDAATYFDPFDASDIVKKVHCVFSDIKLKNTKIEIGTKVLKKLPDWPKTFQMYNEAIESTLKIDPK